ncbi:proton-conducting transporter transmembrane domain-containing protein [Rhodopirellula sp. P2]|uniref:proton-conducting transporter transmembrane domain-containing protein n=1 Tax=Rhodopirellula sp. P2 TaxID=2127060 RepID=UPI002367B988|nr:proton-conducting transporter membrane subunit [Rhodopirellula sp. P2]WDQ16091.1 proton-conducting transporter membrane subunit [Rhodopirellula sp. P2]
MPDWLTLLPVILPTFLVLAALVPDVVGRRHGFRWRQWITFMVAAQCLVAVAMLLIHLVTWVPSPIAELRIVEVFQPTTWVLYDGLSGLMLILVSFIGWATCQYSIRYLEGDIHQARYFRFSAVSIGAVSWMIASGNLIGFAFGWVAMNLGLHSLLLLKPDQSGATRAAWTKFAINRIGDLALFAAFGLLSVKFDSLVLVDIFESAQAMQLEAGSPPPILVAACFLLFIAAASQSVQFPFHSWLPETLGSPTPVSALMHAGIVNAGGYLVIRFANVFALSPLSMNTMAVVGLITTLVAVTVLMTQTSIKKSLAHSTIAQMGFMMLQCGLGASVPATVHLVAHSLYKSNAFLRSGSVISDRKAIAGAREWNRSLAWYETGFAFTVSCTLFAATWILFGLSPTEKPGGWILGSILCLALTHWIAEAMRSGSRRLVLQSTATAALICFLYVTGFLATDALISNGLPTSTSLLSSRVVGTVVVLGFVGLTFLQTRLGSTTQPAWAQTMQVHASNGFYIEHGIRRVFRLLATS